MDSTEIRQDDVLGELQWNAENDQWEGILTLPNNKDASISVDIEEKNAVIPNGVKTVFKFIKENDVVIKQKIATSMTELYNKTWSEGDTITQQEFANRIVLEGVSFFTDQGEAELFYSDDDLFAGHTITTFLQPDGKITEPNLAG